MKALNIFALGCVAVTSLFVMWMIWWLTGLLADRSWCFTALGAGAGSGADGFTACVGLLTIQIKALATNSVILVGVIAMCLLALMVIVVAQGKLSLKASKDGIETDISGDDTIQSGDTVTMEKQQ
jgi:hypothetical protein